MCRKSIVSVKLKKTALLASKSAKRGSISILPRNLQASPKRFFRLANIPASHLFAGSIIIRHKTLDHFAVAFRALGGFLWHLFLFVTGHTTDVVGASVFRYLCFITICLRQQRSANDLVRATNPVNVCGWMRM